MESVKTEDQKLQMLFDGELTPEEEAALRRDLEQSEEGVAQLREWEQLRDAMRSASAEWSGAIDSDALFSRIEAEISVPNVVELPTPKEEPPTLHAVPGTRERRIWGVAATGFAAAAAIFLAVMSWPSDPAPSDLPLARGTEVLQVDFGDNTGTIFNVEGGAGQSLAVVWIDEEEVGLP